MVGKPLGCVSANLGQNRSDNVRSMALSFPESVVAPTGFALEGHEMRKGFTRKPQGDEPATRGKNYITPSGLQRLKDEHRFLLTRERPAVKEVVAWAASKAIGVKTPTISTASGGCGRSMGGFAFSGSESKPRKWWTRKLREWGKRRRGHSSERPCAMPMPRERSEW